MEDVGIVIGVGFLGGRCVRSGMRSGLFSSWWGVCLGFWEFS